MKKKLYRIGIPFIMLVITVLLILFIKNNLPVWKGEDTSEANVYTKHYVLISEDMTTAFWQGVYQSARQEAEKNDIYLEQIGDDLPEEYTLEDYLRISIASKVDGIILCPDGSEEVAKLIDEADKEGIPVVTVLKDESDTSRISFVGINSYELGLDYGEQILGQITEATKNIYILFHSSESKSTNDVVFSQIKKTLNENLGENSINIQPYFIANDSEFDSEEAIRDIFIETENLPDILVCMEEVDTECACQAIVDYNKVGTVTIIGSYSSDIILEAISKKLAALTVTMDTKQLGVQCVQALKEYEEMGYVSNYFNADLHIINEDNVDSELKDQSGAIDK